MELTAGPVLNLGFLIDDVMERVKPLYWDAVLDAAIPLKVPAVAHGVTQPVSPLFSLSHQLVACCTVVQHKLCRLSIRRAFM